MFVQHLDQLCSYNSGLCSKWVWNPCSRGTGFTWTDMEEFTNSVSSGKGSQSGDLNWWNAVMKYFCWETGKSHFVNQERRDTWNDCSECTKSDNFGCSQRNNFTLNIMKPRLNRREAILSPCVSIKCCYILSTCSQCAHTLCSECIVQLYTRSVVH